jgi:protein-glutamine gamma-glutamyltransferase
MTPPRFLLGAALLFWGAMTERVVPGLACALLVEGAHWTRVRWNFGERAFLNAWRLSVLFLLVTMVLVLLNGARLDAMPIVFTWLPVVLMPLEFVQVYGMSSTTTLATFSMMVRRRRDHALKYGLPFREIRFGFGNVYLCATLLASCLGSRADMPAFYPLLVLLGGWALMSASGRAWKQVGVAFLCSVLLSGLLGAGGEMGLMKLYRFYMSTLGGSHNSSSALDYARERRTSLGSMGALKQSTEIVWRLIPEQGPLPRLLRVASYNTYLEQGWQADLLPAELVELEPDSDGFTGVSEIINPDNPNDLEDKFLIAAPNLSDQKTAAAHNLPRFRLRGATPSSQNYSLLPLPGNAASLHQFDPAEFDRNPFGTFRLKPSQPVADAVVLWHPNFSPELPPWEALASSYDRRRFDFPPVTADAKKRVTVEPEFQIPPSEAPVIARVAMELGLREVPLEEKIARLRKHFVKNFRYTRYNRTAENFDPAKDGTLLGKFLTHTHAGHCEFFATSTALLLREAGVPTRYVTGFMAAEIDQKTGQALLRGTHAHAWCRAWDAELKRWIDVDLTPPDWLGLETPRMARFQGLTDWLQQVREDLLVWRDQPGHMMWITLGLLAPLALGVAYIGRNLWRSRSRLDAEKARLRGATVVTTPLAALEKPARKLLGERPPGTPLAPWLMRLSSRLPQPELLARALALHHRLRFDPAAPAAELTTELRSLVDGLRRDLGARRV